jgi:hypothetical protein
MSTGDMALCLKYSCESNGRTIRFHLQSGGDLVCSSPGQRVSARKPYRGTLECPDPALYCRNLKILLTQKK